MTIPNMSRDSGLASLHGQKEIVREEGWDVRDGGEGGGYYKGKNDEMQREEMKLM